MFSVRIVLVCLAATIAQSYAACPNANFIKPCSCKGTFTGRQVLCRQVSSARPIRNALNILESYPLDTFLWHQVQIEDYLPLDFFYRVKIYWFRAIDSRFSFYPEQLPFDGQQDTISRLHFVRSAVDIPNLPLDHLLQLRELYVQEYNMSEVKTEWVARWPEKLTVLRLQQCNIKKLDPFVFQKFVNLKVLALDHNQISKFERKMLPKEMDELHTFDLSNNQLSDLTRAFFILMPKLRRVHLVQNHFTQLPWITWYPVWRGLEDVQLTDNPIKCDKDLEWICGVRIPTVFEGTCSTPSALKGMGLSALTPNLLE